METKALLSKAVKNWPGIVILLVLASIMAMSMTDDINNMQAATTNYEYYQNYIYLIVNIAITYFFCIFALMRFLPNINKQYSKWCVRLYYLLGISALLYFAFAGIFIKHVFSLVEIEYINNFHGLAHKLYTGPLYWIIIGYFFVPKILKDARKMKEEQDLTI
jgi:hypothetical protein